VAVTYGIHAGLQNTTVDEVQELWRRVEDLGFGWISVWDHFYAADLVGADCLEAVGMHAALACRTERVRCACLVYSVGYRHPAVLANAMATIDHLSGGRCDVGIGAGWHQMEYQAYGIPFPPTGPRMDMLEEGIQCLRGLLRNESTTFEGRYFQLTDARCDPRPVQPALPVWVGGGGEKRTLPIAARYADGWNVPFVSVEDFDRKRKLLAGLCEEAGRDPGEVRGAVNVALAFTEDSLQAQFGGIAEMVRPAALSGSDEEVIDRLGQYVEAGADQVNIAVRPPFDFESLERLAPLLP